MAHVQKLYNIRFICLLSALTCLGLISLFYLSNKTAKLPERPPTFDELMVLADKNLAKNALVNSYIYSQKEGVGFKTIMALAKTGNTKAEVMACYLLITGTGVKKNEQLGYPLCEKAAIKGSIPAKTNLIYRDFNNDPENMNWQETYAAFEGLMKTDPGAAHRGLQFLYRQNHPKASRLKMFYHLKQAIKHNNTNAMHALSEFDLRIHPKGLRNPARAEKNLKKAYDLNDFDAGFTLALEYREGNMIEQNIPQYESMIKHMAIFLHPKSMAELGYMYATGKGVEQNLEKSNALYSKAAEFGHPYSQERMGYYFLFGPVESRDYETGVRYLETQAKNGSVAAMTELAHYYAKPDIQDPKNQRIIWLVEAAIRGDKNSQETLGFGMMETGYIEEMQPYIKTLQDAHKRGNPDASYLLARHYRAASGVERDLPKAQNILSKVTHLNHPRVKEEVDIIKGYISHFGGIDAVPDIITL